MKNINILYGIQVILFLVPFFIYGDNSMLTVALGFVVSAPVAVYNLVFFGKNQNLLIYTLELLWVALALLSLVLLVTLYFNKEVILNPFG